jgi:XTP/dITP diphosphohydrolase
VSDLPTSILCATGNAHKLTEFREILEPMGIAVQAPADIGCLPEVIEDGDTFEANAGKKALSAAAHTGGWALADDSGIEARALDWQPGVYSARYAGTHGDDAANNAKLVEALRNHSDRYVQYRCVIALARPGQDLLCWDGTFAGELVLEARGDGGFGYDPYVLVPDLGCTVAELSADAKHARSHRGQALRAFAAWLGEQAD